MNWRKSSYSGSQGGNCVEASSWRKSTFCMNDNDGTCVEAAQGPGVVGVRDSWPGNPGLVLEFPASAWARFITALH